MRGKYCSHYSIDFFENLRQHIVLKYRLKIY